MTMNFKTKYLNKISDYLINNGYEVDDPPKSCDYLDVWGKFKGKKCFTEIYVTIVKFKDGVLGVWNHPGDEPDIEVFMDVDGVLKGTDGLHEILDGLKPVKKIDYMKTLAKEEFYNIVIYELPKVKVKLKKTKRGMEWVKATRKDAALSKRLSTRLANLLDIIEKK
jgi:hypothetical protein